MSAAATNHYLGLFKTTRIPSCAVSIQDLRRLYSELAASAASALEIHIAGVRKPETTSDEDWVSLQEKVRDIGRLSAVVIGTNGEQGVAQSAAPLADEHLPGKIASVTFDSYAALGRENVLPFNRFKLVLDFTEPPTFQAYNPWDAPTPNGSVLEVTGSDSTWATGVYESVLGFFRARARRRRWLHSPVTFSALSWLVGMPAALWVIYRLDTAANQFFGSLDPVLRGSIYIYAFLVTFLLFRLIIGAMRWTFPIIEFQGARSATVRRSIGVVVSSLILAFAYDVLRTLV